MADEGRVTGQVWRWTVLASMASYIDAGSIVGLLAAFSSNAISTAVGALIGGRLGDLWGRKRIYQFDLLVYAFGILWIVFAQSTWMLFVGYVLVGLAVGADVPTSWSLVGEFSPNRARARLLGLTPSPAARRAGDSPWARRGSCRAGPTRCSAAAASARGGSTRTRRSAACRRARRTR